MPPQTISRSMPGWLILMGALTAIGPFSIDMYLPAFPSIAAGLGVERGEVERTLAAYLIGMAGAQIIYGPLADRYGRKLPMMGGLILYVLASLGCALAGDIQTLTAWRVAQALGGAAGVVIPRAVIRDHYETQEAARAMSLLMLIMGLAPILAPLAGAQLLAFVGWRSLFWLMAAGGLALLLAVALTMKETLAPERVLPLRAGTILSNYRALLAHRGFMGHSLAGGMGQAGMFAYIVGSPRIFIELYGIAPQYYGLLFGANAAALIVGSQISARLLRKSAPATLQQRAQVALAVASLSALALALLGLMSLPLLMACLMGYMFSQGFVNPNSAALALAEQGRRLGAASALLGTLQLSCGALAGLIISIWPAESVLPLAAVLAGSACLSWQFGRMARRPA
ncbi:multidrug effflux MFS transporter [Bordetella bronchiseptica]|uniref:multidrug effflux MFS transporter n=1 Tax=Bordetella bronchiseptica TaxID=518 RepID=UPI0002EB22A2|nr:multidrug effflux MFS transporter [Bordetella bronchiseptica]AUL15033.1 Bcr/CflA family drug resistance efflux transporter [Bordetella bronchiseptica]AWP58132.1 Bcr/CflA family drug resistance efflux transporter [Bordetella bronchiseptica]AWQ04864.1 Bcr/CflA family drug resistance efflux transporter [Bordetella bronchiseptica]AZW30428.1 Bcr/CflA family drug resistance efflux transporter [Bordetella bronchiseptica]KDC93242.1 drug resistance transporter, Bcr/CflA family [Bordetella bronchisep